MVDYDCDGCPYFIHNRYGDFEGIAFIYKADSSYNISIVDSIFIIPRRWKEKFDAIVLQDAYERAMNESKENQ